MSAQIRVLVTGASAGVGLALTKHLASTGYKVYGCARNIKKIKDLDCPGKDNIHAVKCDVSKEDQVTAMFELINSTSGGLDICVNNAGLAFDETLLDGSPDAWRQMYEVNVVGLCMVTQQAIRSMKLGGGDNCIVLNVNSVLGVASFKMNLTNRGFYSGTKHAVTGITAALRGEISKAGLDDRIRVMQIYPGLIETEFALRSSGEEVGRRQYANTRPLQAEDVVDCIVHTLSTPKHVTITDQIVYPTQDLNKK